MKFKNCNELSEEWFHTIYEFCTGDVADSVNFNRSKMGLGPGNIEDLSKFVRSTIGCTDNLASKIAKEVPWLLEP